MEEYEEISPEDIRVGDVITLKYGGHRGSGSFGPWGTQTLTVVKLETRVIDGIFGNGNPIRDFGIDVTGHIEDGLYIWVRKPTYKSYDPEQIGDQEDDL